MLSSAMRWLALLIAVGTVCILPWLLGGVIPVARLVLLTGSTMATACCVIAGGLSWRNSAGLPVIALLASGLGGLGLMQMLPIFSPTVAGMNHAVNFEFRTEQQGDFATPFETDRTVRTISLADTRTAVAQWMCLAMLVFVGSQTMGSRRRLCAGLALLTLNSTAIALTGLLQQFGDGKMMIGSRWIRFQSTPFATFTNPNNAAGWLGVHLAAAVALLVLVWGPGVALPYSHAFQKPSLNDRLWNLIGLFQFRLARLKNPQILASMAVMLLLVAILATLSRAGIVAALSGLLVGSVCRMRGRQAVLIILPFLLLAAACMFVLKLLELDEVVLTELSTLQNPVSETSIRIQHWTYALKALLDFPLIGLGMNSYRFATLPYIGMSHDKWFHHADNQFVEMAVETGAIGFCLFSGIWFALIFAGIRLSQSIKSATGRGRSRLVALTMLAMILGSSQVVAGSFDYGCGLPATSSAILLLCGAVVAPFVSAGDGSGRRKQEVRSVRSLRFWAQARMLTVSMQIALATAAICFAPDLVAAHRIYEQVLAVEKILKNPVSQSGLSVLNELEPRLRYQLQQRPDDADGLKAIADLQEARFRFAMMAAVDDDLAELSDADFAQAWELLTPIGLAIRILNIESAGQQQIAEDIQSLAIRTFADYPWSDDTREARRQVPLIPGTSLDLLCVHVMTDPEPLNESLVKQAIFSEPGSSRRLFQTGYLCLSRDREDLAELAWSCALKASERFRVEILTAAAQHWSVDEVVRRFGAMDFAATVRSASLVKNEEIQKLLWDQAGELWKQLSDECTPDQCYQRAIQLQRTEDDKAAIDWLNTCFERFPDDQRLSVLSATILEKQGKIEEAIGQWMRIQFYHPRHQAAEKAIQRLRRKL